MYDLTKLTAVVLDILPMAKLEMYTNCVEVRFVITAQGPNYGNVLTAGFEEKHLWSDSKRTPTEYTLKALAKSIEQHPDYQGVSRDQFNPSLGRVKW